MKKVLVIGSGGREHAIVDALGRSPQVGEIFCAPGNAGISLQATCVPIKDTDVDGLLHFAQTQGVDLTVIGPEAALAAGVVDAFRAAGLAVFGHTKAATQIESSKEFAKRLMLKYDVPTAAYRSFSDYDEALAYVSGRPFPAVLKYDGLAAGKGVILAKTRDEAEAAIRSILDDHQFGAAGVSHGAEVVCLTGTGSVRGVNLTVTDLLDASLALTGDLTLADGVTVLARPAPTTVSGTLIIAGGGTVALPETCEPPTVYPLFTANALSGAANFADWTFANLPRGTKASIKTDNEAVSVHVVNSGMTVIFR